MPAIAWNDWGAEAFARAGSEGKLLFLLISAGWCPGCRDLEGVSLSDPRIRARLSESYVCIRVDSDLRPDLNDRYNQGGWPSVAVLFSDGRILTGATRLPPDPLLAVLDRCAAFYRNDRERIDAWLAIPARVPEASDSTDSSASDSCDVPGEDLLPLVRQAVISQVDPVYPGFFGEPKHLMVDALAFLRDLWLFEPGAEPGETFLSILRRMVQSEVHDTDGGGFFRYAERRDWTGAVPEKRLEDNAGMLSLCASAFELSGDPLFADAARGTLRFLLLSLRDAESGAFFSGPDADAATGRRIIVSEYNALAVSALIVAARAFPESGEGTSGDGLLQRAIQVGRFLSENLYPGYLADQVAAVTAYLDLRDATQDSGWLDRATDVIDRVRRTLFDPRVGLFSDRVGRSDDQGLLRVPRYPFGANSGAAAALIRCAELTGREDLLVAGRRLLVRLSEVFDERSGPFNASYGSALLRDRHGKAGKEALPGDPA